MLSIITMALIFFGQCYWLFNQYLYSMDDSIREMQVACDSVLEKEFEIRYEKFHEKYMEGRDTKLMINIHMFDSITLNNKHGGSGTNYVRFRFSADSIMPKEKTVTIRNAKSENSTRYINRYLTLRILYIIETKKIDAYLLSVENYHKKTNQQHQFSESMLLNISHVNLSLIMDDVSARCSHKNFLL